MTSMSWRHLKIISCFFFCGMNKMLSQVDKNATEKDIKKEYRRLSRLHHPDRGGDASKAQEINAAYEILSDSEKRKKYDMHGLDGLEDDGGGGRSRGSDIFSSFFGQPRSRGPQKSPDVNHPVSILRYFFVLLSRECDSILLCGFE